MTSSRGRRESYVRRRYLAAFTASLIIHLVVGAFFAVRILTPSTSESAASNESNEAIAVTEDRGAAGAPIDVVSARPSVAPETPPASPPPPSVAPPVPVPVPVNAVVPPPVRPTVRPTKPRVARRLPGRPELAKDATDGTPEPERISVIAPPVVPDSEPSAVLATLPPTAAPTLPPTATPTVAPTRPPTAAPTQPPTAVPTLPPTAAPTLPPTAAPTRPLTAAPTRPPTAAPSLPPTAAPPTARPTAARTPVPVAVAPRPAPTAGPPTAAPVAAPARIVAKPTAPASAAATPGAAVAEHPRVAATATAGTDAGQHGSSGSGLRPEPSGSPGPPGSAGRSPATTAYAPVAGSAPGAAAGSSLDHLNSRLNGLLSAGDPVSYSRKHYENDLGAAVAQVEEQYYKAAAPPQSVLDKAIDIVRQHGLLGPPVVVYILKRQRILGIEICTGWQIESTATGPQGGYTFGPCSGEKFTPAGGLPTLPPKRGASPEP